MAGLFKALIWFLYSNVRLGSFMFVSKGLAYAVLNLQYDISIVLSVSEKNNGLGSTSSFKQNNGARTEFMRKLK